MINAAEVEALERRLIRAKEDPAGEPMDYLELKQLVADTRRRFREQQEILGNRQGLVGGDAVPQGTVPGGG